MKKTLLLITLVAFVFILTGCFKKEEKMEMKEEQGQQSQVQTRQEKESIFDFFKNKQSVKCDIRNLQTGDEYEIFTKDDKVRINGFKYMSFGNEVDLDSGYLINDGEWSYMWSGKEGMKINIEKMEGDTGEGDMGDWNEWLASEEERGVNFECQPQNIDESQFIPPQDVEFKDFNELMQGFGNMDGNFDQNFLLEGGGVEPE